MYSHGRPRVLLYSQGALGLGNLKRSLLLSEELARKHPDASILLTTGSPIVQGFSLPPRTACVPLPPLDGIPIDLARARWLASGGGGAGDARAGILVARERILLETARRLDPDLLIVDKHAIGVGGELQPTLEWLRRRGRCRRVLGLRDVLDEPERTREALTRAGAFAAMERLYDEVWIYGAEAVFDAAKEYAFPDPVRAKTRYCGYLRRPSPPCPPRSGRPRVLVTAGGGADGRALIEAFLAGAVHLGLPRRLDSTVVLGPLMPRSQREALRVRYGGEPGVELHDFLADLGPHYAAADAVVSMAGYNTVCELLGHGCRALLVPRSRPVQEQLIRARRLAQLEIFDMLEPEELEPEELVTRLLARLEEPRGVGRPLDVDGLSRICERAGALLGVAS